MDKIEKILELAYKNNKKISMDEILDFNLEEEEYSLLVNTFKKSGVEIIKNECEKEVIEEFNFKYNDDVNLYLSEISRIPLLSIKEEQELFEKYKNTKDPKIRERLMVSNLRLVVNIAKKYLPYIKKTIVSFLDLIQDGNEGLSKAIDKFDVSLGYKFSTYASWWIRQGITRNLSEFSRTIRVPMYLCEKYNNIKKYKEQQLIEKNIVPNDMEIAEAFGITKEQLKKIINVVEQTPVSLNENINDESDSVLMDFVESEDELIEEIVERKNEKEVLVEMMASALNLREKVVLSYRFGLKNEYNKYGISMTLEEAGKKIGITRERVRQIEAKALKKLRNKERVKQMRLERQK